MSDGGPPAKHRRAVRTCVRTHHSCTQMVRPWALRPPTAIEVYVRTFGERADVMYWCIVEAEEAGTNDSKTVGQMYGVTRPRFVKNVDVYYVNVAKVAAPLIEANLVRYECGRWITTKGNQ